MREPNAPILSYFSCSCPFLPGTTADLASLAEEKNPDCGNSGQKWGPSGFPPHDRARVLKTLRRHRLLVDVTRSLGASASLLGANVGWDPGLQITAPMCCLM